MSLSRSTRVLPGKVLGASIGDCVHVAGVYNFLRLAETQGYGTVFLGPAVTLERLVEAIRLERPQLVGISYRLTPRAAEELICRLKGLLVSLDLLGGRRYVFGGTPPVARVARDSGLFEAVFDGTESEEEVIGFLRGSKLGRTEELYPQRLVERIAAKAPYPIIRHHFGLPSLEDTIKGIQRLAEARVLDVISLGPDQNAQESFFRPEEMDPLQHGAGGVPVRSPEDFRALYAASRRGNYPLMRCYSGTRDLIPMAAMLKETINLAWGAVPLMWYNVLDGRSRRPLEASIREAQAAMRWHAEHGIPLEVNEAHQWSLRDAHDVVAVVTAFLAAYNAKKAGVRHYVAQYMFNTPPATSPVMDLAKMLAKVELIESLHDEGFVSFRQTRTGLASMPVNPAVAKGHLAASTLLQMHLRPHIVHVVAHCEADHAAAPEDIIESVNVARGAIRNALSGQPDLTLDSSVQERKRELVAEARVLLEAISSIAPEGVEDPWADPATLARAVEIGLLDAPHLRGNSAACGAVITRMVRGACCAVDPSDGRPLKEAERISQILNGVSRSFRHVKLV